MLVHDIRKNQTRVIDFRETAPSAIHEEMLLKNLDLNVSVFFRFHHVSEIKILKVFAFDKSVPLLLLSHYSQVCLWEYQACLAGFIRHTNSTAGTVTIIHHFSFITLCLQHEVNGHNVSYGRYLYCFVARP